MSLFQRFFRSAHSRTPDADDPVLLAQRGLAELKQALGKAMTGLSDLRNQALRARRESESLRRLAEDDERLAVKHLREGQNGGLDPAEADRLAAAALERRAERLASGDQALTDADRFDELAAKLEGDVGRIKAAVSRTEAEMLTLKARARTASAARTIGEIAAGFDPDQTVAMLAEARARVEEAEALAEAYGTLSASGADKAIDAALEDAPSKSGPGALEDLKRKMGIG